MRGVLLSSFLVLFLQVSSLAQAIRVFDEDVSLVTMSRNGNWLAGYRGVSGDTNTFVWAEATEFLTLDLARGTDPTFELPVVPLGISDDGFIYAGHGESPRSHDSDTEVFRWTDDVGWDTLTASDSDFKRMSADGRAIAGNLYRDDDPVDDAHHAFHWSVDSGLTQIPEVAIEGADLLQGWSMDLSSDGQVVVGYSLGTFSDSRDRVMEAFHWSESTGTQRLGLLEANHVGSVATAVSPDGQMIGGQSLADPSETNTIPFIWNQAAGMVALPTNDSYIEVQSISRNAKLILGRDKDDQFYVWDERRRLHLLADFFESQAGIDLSQWSSLSAVQMSDDGTVFIGRAIRQDDTFNDWRVMLVPEPGERILTWVGLVAVMVLRRCHRHRRPCSN